MWIKPPAPQQNMTNPPDTRIFTPLMVPGLSVAIGHQLNESKRLEPVHRGAISRLELIEANSSGKVMAK